MTATSVAQALLALLSDDPARPLVTHLGPGGERTELSVRTFENNVAKAANLLRDDADLQPGSAVALLLPVHWQTAVWLAACALAGGVAWLDGDPADPSVEVSVTGPDRLDAPRAPMALATALHPLGMPFAAPLPAGLLDASVEVRAHGDRFPAYDEASRHAGAAWLRTGDRDWTQGGALDAGAALAAEAGVGRGSRLLCPVGHRNAVLAAVAAPLAVAGSVVLVADPGADLDAVAERERCDGLLR